MKITHAMLAATIVATTILSGCASYPEQSNTSTYPASSSSPSSYSSYGVVNAILSDVQLGKQTRRWSVALCCDGKEDMLSADVLVFEPIGFLVGKVNDTLDTRRNKDLPRAAAKDIRLRAGS